MSVLTPRDRRTPSTPSSPTAPTRRRRCTRGIRALSMLWGEWEVTELRRDMGLTDLAVSMPTRRLIPRTTPRSRPLSSCSAASGYAPFSSNPSHWPPITHSRLGLRLGRGLDRLHRRRHAHRTHRPHPPAGQVHGGGRPGAQRGAQLHVDQDGRARRLLWRRR